ncbi:glycerate kinase [Psychrobacter pygoscelis]|uniref:glycerate kinase n=1 Tax=Psychrobacter pygoscelis TaxID=2488563 RepID=UPI00103D1A21|nr:glycerate kinase [Psychrobacter pygoscelis]
MKILIAPDSFKESLEAIEVCQAIQSGFRQVFADADYTLLPMADGGEGTSDVLSYALDGRWKEITVHDPLMRLIKAKYLLLAEGTAVIEMARASGLHLLTTEERNPLATSSYGVGELVADALAEGAKRIIIGLGGSATNDAGLGMLSALGVKFYDAQGNLLSQGGAELAKLTRIDTSDLSPGVTNAVFEVACDVTNPLCGELGASAVFGPQKGASLEQVAQLDKALNNFAQVCQQQGFDDCQNIAGAGAAGGLGFALMRFCAAQLQSGFTTVAETLKLSEHIANADLVITGEGKLDTQTAMGKVAGGISQIARQHGVPVMAICGSVDGLNRAQTTQFEVVMPSIQKIEPIQQVLENAYDNIETTAANLAAAMRLGQMMSVMY